MFKTPDWGEDVPKLHTNFLKKNEVKGKKSSEGKAKVSLNVNKVKGKKQTNTQKKQTHPQTKLSPKLNNKNNFKNKKHSPVKTKPLKNNYVTSPKVIKDNNSTEMNKSVTNGNNKESRKRKLENKPVNTKKKKSKHGQQNLDKIAETQNFDELLINAKKKKFNEVIENDDQEDILFTENKEKKKTGKKNKKSSNDDLTNNNEVPLHSKKARLKAMLNVQSSRSHINVGNKSNQLRERMMERLKAAQFRYLNEKLYTSSGSEAQELFQSDPAAFETYHQGYQLQVKKWPVNPLDVIVKKIMKMPKSHLIADMGCGEAALSRRIPHSVRSFDLVATAPGVETCDMARTPLLTASVDAAVYCLALMGTDLTQYLVEANRVLKMGGHLLIAEVESRFDNVENFTKEVSRLGFKLKQLDKSNNVFFFMEFTKTGDPPVKKAKLPALTLKPCIYKRR